jgi:hypothetical protein
VPACKCIAAKQLELQRNQEIFDAVNFWTNHSERDRVVCFVAVILFDYDDRRTVELIRQRKGEEMPNNTMSNSKNTAASRLLLRCLILRSADCGRKK